MNGTVVVLAAGRGTRLGTHAPPSGKAMVHVADKPLLSHAISFAEQVFSDVVVVTGGHAEAPTAWIAAHHPSVRTVNNPRFRDGNLHSLAVALPLAPGPLLVMNADHLYSAGVAHRVVRTLAHSNVTAFCDHDRALTDDDMKVALSESGRIAQIDKRLTRWDVGYVGMTFVPAARRQAYERVLTELSVESSAHVEAILATLALTPTPPTVADISGLGWVEVDTPEELSAAQDFARSHLGQAP